MECCGEYSDCPHICPLRDMAYVGDCIQVKAKAALDLINRLEAEKEVLQAHIQKLLYFEDDTIIGVKDKWLVINMESEKLGEAIKSCVDYLTKNARGR